MISPPSLSHGTRALPISLSPRPNHRSLTIVPLIAVVCFVPSPAQAHEGHKDILGHLLYTAQKVAKDENLCEGFRVVINDGPGGCQSVYHLHLHVIGGRQLTWPPG